MQRDYLYVHGFTVFSPKALYIRISKARKDVAILDVYLEWGAGQTMPLPGAEPLTLPTVIHPAGWLDFAVQMHDLTLLLQERGHILSADVQLVVKDGEGNLHRKRIVINDIPIWAKGGDPTNVR